MQAKDSKIAICRHLKTNGRRCLSPALAGGALCYFHRTLHLTHRRPETVPALTSYWQEATVEAESERGEADESTLARVYPKQDQIPFPALEDAESVQLATSMLFQAIATGQIHFKRARLLLYTLKIACINQRALANAAKADPGPIPTRIVRTTRGEILAAPSEDDAQADAEAAQAHAEAQVEAEVEAAAAHAQAQAGTAPQPQPAIPPIPASPTSAQPISGSNSDSDSNTQPSLSKSPQPETLALEHPEHPDHPEPAAPPAEPVAAALVLRLLKARVQSLKDAANLPNPPESSRNQPETNILAVSDLDAVFCRHSRPLCR